VRAFSAFFALGSQRARIQRVNRLKGESFFNNKFPRGIRELLYKYDFKRRYNTPRTPFCTSDYAICESRERERELLGCAPSSSSTAKDIGGITLSSLITHQHRTNTENNLHSASLPSINKCMRLVILGPNIKAVPLQFMQRPPV
jgi:hypothetical protein